MERQRGHNGISKTVRYRAVRHTLSALFHEGWDEPAVTEVLKVIEARADGVTLDELEQRLPESFARCHRSFIVAKSHIKNIYVEFYK